MLTVASRSALLLMLISGMKERLWLAVFERATIVPENRCQCKAQCRSALRADCGRIGTQNFGRGSADAIRLTLSAFGSENRTTLFGSENRTTLRFAATRGQERIDVLAQFIAPAPTVFVEADHLKASIHLAANQITE